MRNKEMTHTDTHLDDCSDDYYYGYDEGNNLVAFEDEVDCYNGACGFFEFFESQAIYNLATEAEFNSQRVADDRKLNHAQRSKDNSIRLKATEEKRNSNEQFRISDNKRRAAAHKAERERNHEKVKEATRRRVAKHRAKKKALGM